MSETATADAGRNLFTGEARKTFPGRESGFSKFIAEETARVRAASGAGDRRRTFKDTSDPGLLLLIGPRGASFVFKGQTRLDAAGRRKDVKVKLGGVGELSLAAARARAEEIRNQLAAGQEIAGERAKRREARAELAKEGAAAAQVQETIETILRKGSRPAPETFAALRHASLAKCVDAYELHGFPRDTKPERRQEVLANMRLAIEEARAEEKTPDELETLAISHAIANHTNSTARKRASALRVLYRRLMSWKAATGNPAAGLEPIPAPPARERYANAAELKAIWEACDELPQARADFTRLLILLPLRRDELANLRVRDLETSMGIFQLKIEKARSKTKAEHRLPLVGEAANIVRRLVQGREPDDFLIPLTETGKAFDAWTAFKNQLRAKSGQEWFYFHSCRKCFSTEAEEHGLEEYGTIDACLNHAQAQSRTGSGRSYNFAKIMPRRAALLAAWGEVVAQAVQSGVWPRHDETTHPGGNIVPFGARV